MLPNPRLDVGDVSVPRAARQALASRLRRAGQAAGVPAPIWATLGVRIVGDDEMARMHVDFMGEDGPTDVMAFPGSAAYNADELGAEDAQLLSAWGEGDDEYDDDAGDVAEDDSKESDDEGSFDDGAWLRNDQDLGAGLSASLGDIVIDWEQVCRQARDGSLAALVDEATILLVHGLCHLLGHDHRRRGEGRRMHRAEARLLRALRVPDVPRPYAPTAVAMGARTSTPPRRTGRSPEKAGRTG